jgi:hypothetical protein
MSKLTVLEFSKEFHFIWWCHGEWKSVVMGWEILKFLLLPGCAIVTALCSKSKKCTALVFLLLLLDCDWMLAFIHGIRMWPYLFFDKWCYWVLFHFLLCCGIWLDNNLCGEVWNQLSLFLSAVCLCGRNKGSFMIDVRPIHFLDVVPTYLSLWRLVKESLILLFLFLYKFNALCAVILC